MEITKERYIHNKIYLVATFTSEHSNMIMAVPYLVLALNLLSEEAFDHNAHTQAWTLTQHITYN